MAKHVIHDPTIYELAEAMGCWPKHLLRLAKAMKIQTHRSFLKRHGQRASRPLRAREVEAILEAHALVPIVTRSRIGVLNIVGRRMRRRRPPGHA